MFTGIRRQTIRKLHYHHFRALRMALSHLAVGFQFSAEIKQLSGVRLS